MAKLSANQQTTVLDALMKASSKHWQQINLTKPEALAAIDGLDTYQNDNTTPINLAIPQPARNNLTAGQKATLFTGVAIARYIRDGADLNVLSDFVNRAISLAT